MRKKIYALICVVVAVASLCGCSAANQTLPPFGEGQSLWNPDMNAEEPTEEVTTEAVEELPLCTYEIDGGTVTFTGTGKVDEKTSSHTPQWIEDIGGADKVTAVVISEGITAIGSGAFNGCKNLESIVIPKSVKVIPLNMARNCAALKTLVLPEGLTIISEGAFSSCTALEAVEIPSTVVELGKHSFSNCTALTEFVIPDSVTTLGDYTLTSCANLEKLTIGKGVTILPRGFSAQNKKLTEVVILGSIKSYESQAFGFCVIIEEFVVPYGAERIADAVFTENNNLKKITIPSTVTFIAHEQFKTAHEDLVIYGVAGSKAEEYAASYEIPFVSIEE